VTACASSGGVSAAFGRLETTETLTPDAIEARARDLLAELTLDEKIGMMDGDAPFWLGLADMVAGGYNKHPWVAGAVPRLGIPGVRFSDGPRGVVMPGATTFPVSMARGATWDVDLEERIGDAIGRELRALGGNLFGGVCVNLLRHPAWGRSQETYGEDTHHLGAFGAALTRGVQRHVMACVKHYALNSMECARFRVDVRIDPRALHEVYLPHFRRVVNAGVASVMSAYNSVNGEWCGQNASLLTDVLRNGWGFEGFVLSDFIWGVRDARKAALAGLDLEMPFRNLYHRSLRALVEHGDVPIAGIERAVLRVLRQQIRFARAGDPGQYAADVVGSAKHRELAREVARRSIVLLKNESRVLPLGDPKRVALIGTLADVPNTGDGGSSNTFPAYVVTPLQGLRAALGDGVTLVHDDGREPAHAAAVAADAEVAICVVGYTRRDEGEYISTETPAELASLFPPPTPDELPMVESLMAAGGALAASTGGDRTSLTLHREDEALIQCVAAANPRTVVVIMAGSAVITEAWRERVPAILMLWYPGMEGGHALADVLLGRVNPSGKLPCTFPRRAEDLPRFDPHATAVTYDLWHGYRKLERDGAAPAFAFGFGLSYTTFAYRNLRLAQARVGADDAVVATVDVTNTGTVAGAEVVQLYVAAPGSRVERAPKELKAFARVELAPGETRSVRLEVAVADLAYYDPSRAWVLEPITYEVIVGRHSRDADALRARWQVT
jgi:beta-glucosidase